MIISHENKYVFVEIPHTGTTAIGEELCTNYGGQSILWRHSYYSDFLKQAGPEEKNYFVFCSIRNPLDLTVSEYFRMFTDHKGIFTDPEKLKLRANREQRRKQKFYQQLKSQEMDFQTYFLKYYKRPYNSWASLMHGKYDFVIRFENLQEDFARLLQRLGLEPKRPLPVRNSTQGRNKDFWSYYSPEMIPRAKRVFGPFMKQWGYEFPAEWGQANVTWLNKLEFELLTLFKKAKWTYFRSLFYYPQR
ncbi:MAG TPA: sulfotransferase family 2 domain-containing protein [Anaerolineales bacterium]|nr:sulfotransferase family 2 domain-containing protein [Anaerolineales bacterium]